MSTSRRRILSLIARGVCAAPLAGGLFVAASAPSRLEKEREAARREGVPLEPRDLQPRPAILPEQNAGPLLQEITREYNAIPASERHPWEFCKFLEKPDDPKEIATVQSGLTRCAALIRLAETAAALPHCDFHYDYALGPDLLLPELAVVRQCARFFASRALLNNDLADVARAARLGNLASETPVLIAVLVGSACHGMGNNAYQKLLRRPGCDLKAARATLTAFAPAPSPLWSLGGELMLATAITKRARQGKLTMQAIRGGEEPSFDILSVAGPVMASLWEQRLIAFWREVYAAIRASGTDYELMQQRFERISQRWDKSRSPQDLMVKILTPVFTSAIERAHITAEAQRNLRIAALTLWEEREVRAEFPENPTLPIDPFSKKPLGYRRLENGDCLIYSIGPNRIDEGGVEKINNHPADLVVRLSR
jgi:hypothetical protein